MCKVFELSCSRPKLLSKFNNDGYSALNNHHLTRILCFVLPIVREVPERGEIAKKYDIERSKKRQKRDRSGKNIDNKFVKKERLDFE